MTLRLHENRGVSSDFSFFKRRKLGNHACSRIKRKFKSGPVWYIQFYVGDKSRRIRASDNFQIAKEKLRQFESAQARGEDLPLPTRTRIADVLSEYIRHLRSYKTRKSALNDVHYLRSTFGPVCAELVPPSLSRGKRDKRPTAQPKSDRNPRIEVDCIEVVTTADVSRFIDRRVQSRMLSPRTANHYRAVLLRFFNGAMRHRGVRMPGDKNPVSAVQKRREPAPEIRFLTLQQIDEQFKVLESRLQFQAMIATYIFAGLRREKLLWLTHDDIDWRAQPYGLIRIRAKTIDGESWEPKTKVNRMVPISSRLRPYLDRQRVRSAKSIWLFPNLSGNRYNPDNFSSDLRELNAKSGLEWGCLDYRHTFGSQLAMKGESLYKIATMMGNSPQICQQHYAALLPESLIGAVEFPSVLADNLRSSAGL